MYKDTKVRLGFLFGFYSPHQNPTVVATISPPTYPSRFQSLHVHPLHLVYSAIINCAFDVSFLDGLGPGRPMGTYLVEDEGEDGMRRDPQEMSSGTCR